MSDSHFVVCVLAMVAMVLGVRPRRRPDDDGGKQVPGAAVVIRSPAPTKPTARRSPAKGKGKRKKK